MSYTKHKLSLEAQGTLLAAERTALAYARTSLTLLVAGATLIQFFSLAVLQIAGIVLIPVGVGTLIGGGIRYLRLRHQLATLRRPARKR
jgi:putative membrane protein